MAVKGIVLAGGKSRRFGSDKALYKVNDISMLEHSCCLLESVGLPATIIGHKKYEELWFQTVEDIIPNLGPLGGLLTACRIYPNSHLVVLTCDMPFLTKKSIVQLCAQQLQNYSAVFYSFNNQINPQINPFPGIYDSCLVRDILHLLHQGILSMHSLLEKIQNRLIIHLGEPSMEFRNRNYQDDSVVKFDR